MYVRYVKPPVDRVQVLFTDRTVTCHEGLYRLLVIGKLDIFSGSSTFGGSAAAAGGLSPVALVAMKGLNFYILKLGYNCHL